MFPLLSLFFALRIGSFGSPTEPMGISVREEARAVAATMLRSDRIDAVPWNAPGVAAFIDAPGARHSPLFPAYQPEDWVSAVVSTLHVESSTVGRAAVWIATRPVRVDVSRDHVFVRWRISGG
jgi:hypothetical protein